MTDQYNLNEKHIKIIVIDSVHNIYYIICIINKMMITQLLFFMSSLAVVAFSDYRPYHPVKDLDLTLYDGFWYEVYGDSVDRTFQGAGSCITAEYTIQDSGDNVTVYNREIRKDGTVDDIYGYAFYEDGHSGGELSVYLEGAPSIAPYWVVDLGPVVNDSYDYAIVSDDKQFTLFVLARNVTEFFEWYNQTVIVTLQEFGFDKLYNRPIVIPQEDGCLYS